MSLTVPFLPLRWESDDVREDNVFMYIIAVVVVVACFLRELWRYFDYTAALNELRHFKMAAVSCLCD